MGFYVPPHRRGQKESDAGSTGATSAPAEKKSFGFGKSFGSSAPAEPRTVAAAPAASRGRFDNINGFEKRARAFGSSSARAGPNAMAGTFKADVNATSGDNIFQLQSQAQGINFDAYENIPVEVTGDEPIPAPIESFFGDDNLVPEQVQENLKKCGYQRPTPIQKHALPIGLSGRDLMSCAQTGSGKTAAFLLPLIIKMLKNGRPEQYREYANRRACPVSLVLSPTRELAQQIFIEASKFSHAFGIKCACIYGGEPKHLQRAEIQRMNGVDILIATPGRLVDFMTESKPTVSVANVTTLVLDEADRMLELGFDVQVEEIVRNSSMPLCDERQTLLFSATFPDEIQEFAQTYLHPQYVFITVGRVGSTTDNITQRVVHAPENEDGKIDLLIQALRANEEGLQLVFVETKRSCDFLTHVLCEEGIPAAAIHGDREQYEREQALHSFRTGETPVLVATDVAQRGLDIPNVVHVINYDLPNEIQDYVHRIGRTGRCGNTGLATAFINNRSMHLVPDLIEKLRETNQEVPAWFEQMNWSQGGGRRGGPQKFGGRDTRRRGKSAPMRQVTRQSQWDTDNAAGGTGGKWQW